MADQDQSGLHPEDSRLLDSLRGLRWKAARPPLRVNTGGHLSRALAPSAELSEYRPYRQGDDTRRIDWKLMARTDRAFIRLAQDHAQLPTMILVDASPSMAWPAPGHRKYHHARAIALGLAATARAAGDPVGLMISGEQAEQLPPQGRAGTLPRIAAMLRGVAPGKSQGLSLALGRTGARRLVVISDFLGSGQEMEALLSNLSGLRLSGVEVHALHILDQDEISPPSGFDLLHDPLDPQVLRSMDAASRRGYLQNFAAWRETVTGSMRQRGLRYASLITDEPPALAVRRLIRGFDTAPQQSRSA